MADCTYSSDLNPSKIFTKITIKGFFKQTNIKGQEDKSSNSNVTEN